MLYKALDDEADGMTMVEIRLPDELAERAKRAGLLSDDAIGSLLEDAMRRRRAGRAFLDVARRIHDAGIPQMSDDEIVAEVKAARAERWTSPGLPEGNAGRS